MTRLLLNCETPVSALRSLADILITTPETLLEELRVVEIGCNDYADNVEQKLADRFLARREVPDFSVLWFHGTRLHRSHTLMRDGLLPTHMVEDQFRAYLLTMSEGLERLGGSPFGQSKSYKPKVEGPFGMLCRDAAASPSGVNGRYLCRPELIDDIAGELLGENYRALTERYAKESTPCVVHFVGRPVDRVMQKALRYVYETKVERQDAIESANSVSVCFDGGGEPVPPEMIVRIECLLGREVCDD